MRVKVDRPGYILEKLWPVGATFDWPAGHALGSWVHEVAPDGGGVQAELLAPAPSCVRCNSAEPLMHGHHFNESNGRWDDPCPRAVAAPAAAPAPKKGRK